MATKQLHTVFLNENISNNFKRRNSKQYRKVFPSVEQSYGKHNKEKPKVMEIVFWRHIWSTSRTWKVRNKTVSQKIRLTQNERTKYTDSNKDMNSTFVISVRGSRIIGATTNIVSEINLFVSQVDDH